MESRCVLKTDILRTKQKKKKERRESHPESELEVFYFELAAHAERMSPQKCSGPCITNISHLAQQHGELPHVPCWDCLRPRVFHVACLKYASRPCLLPPDSEGGGQSLHLISCQREGLRCNRPKQDLSNAHMPTAPDEGHKGCVTSFPF